MLPMPENTVQVSRVQLSGKSVTIPELNHASGVYKEHYALYYVPKSSILLAGTGVWKISYGACGFSSTKIYNSDYLKSLISSINEVYAMGLSAVCDCGIS